MTGKGGVVLRWAKRGGLVLLALILALAAMGMIFQVTAREIDERRYPPPGDLVDVGGHRLRGIVGTARKIRRLQVD
jgi:hypothetical protein